MGTSGLMSGEGKRSDWPSLKPPRPSSTLLSCRGFPVPRNEIPCFCTGSGGRSTATGDVRGRPAPWRRRACYVRRARENCWRKSYSVLCLFLRGRPWESVHEQLPRWTHRRRQWPRTMLDLAPASPSRGPLRGLSRVRRGGNKSQRLLSNHRKTLKTTMGRPCNKLARMRGRRLVRLASAPRLLGCGRDDFNPIASGSRAVRRFRIEKGVDKAGCAAQVAGA